MNRKERNHILISWITISIAFAMIFSEGFLDGIIPFIKNFSEALFISLIAVGAGFIFHELAHKYVAIHYGAHAEYRMWETGLLLALGLGILSLFTGFGFIFAAPGAVWIYGPHITRKQNGIISIAGPITNIVITLIFLMLLFYFPFGLIGKTLFTGARINLFLAMFNLLPVPPLDGSKVIAWNPTIWGLFFIPIAFFLFF